MEEIGISEILTNFHFFRPYWLMAFIPLILILFLLRQADRRTNAWEEVIDPSLLPYLLQKTDLEKANFLTWLFFFWALIVVALAGPAWQKIPQPVQEKDDALIIVLDLTKSMLAEDVKPNRLTRAKRKIIDILRARDEGETALVVYSGSAFAVSPLSDDSKTISGMIPSLSPEIMPSPGSSLKKAIEITSPREIINLLHDDFELNIENEIINSNKNKAELILKNFFYKQPLTTLNFIHEGEVNSEINYILAEYKTEKSSYSIIIFIKKKLDNLKISRFTINKE